MCEAEYSGGRNDVGEKNEERMQKKKRVSEASLTSDVLLLSRREKWSLQGWTTAPPTSCKSSDHLGLLSSPFWAFHTCKTEDIPYWTSSVAEHLHRLVITQGWQVGSNRWKCSGSLCMAIYMSRSSRWCSWRWCYCECRVIGGRSSARLPRTRYSAGAQLPTECEYISGE